MLSNHCTRCVARLATEDGENGSRAAVGGSVQPIDAAGSIDSIYNSLQERILAMEVRNPTNQLNQTI
jgi:hypothetical protein